MKELTMSHDLDITREVCPMTFVRTRLALDRLPPGDLLRVRLHGAVPLANVRQNTLSLGHEIVSCATSEDGISLIEIRRR